MRTALFCLSILVGVSSDIFAAAAEQIQFCDDGVVDEEYVSVELPTMNPPGNMATVDIVQGGRITMVLDAHDSATVNLCDGYVDHVNCQDYTTTNMYCVEIGQI